MSPAKRRHPILCLSTVLLTVLIFASSGSAVRAQEPDEGETSAQKKQAAAPIDKDVTQGALRIQQPDGSLVECPLVNTDVQADVSGFIARVRVVQTFHNPTDEKIEAVYVFPLPHEAAVDGMTMRIGDRKVVGLIKRRDEARRIYEQALSQGQTAALLEQERPNIFTQSVGNIEPAQVVKIEISYVDVLKYDMGTYEFHFPMVVGPRFIPGSPVSPPQPAEPGLQGKVAPPVANTQRVPDATRISPPVLKPGFRNGHDIQLRVRLDAGVPIQAVRVANHKSEVKAEGDRRAAVTLDSADSIPNKDFVLRYDVVGAKPEMAVLGHTGQYTDTGRLGDGYFLLMIQPKEDEKLKQMPPREIVFLVDTSGSMSGQPTAKVREAMQRMLELCREQDTVQVVTFASQAYKLFEKPVPVTGPNIERAIGFARGLRGAGGTHMLQGVKLAIDEPIDKERLRIIVMLSDGYIGNEAEIIKHVGEHCGDQIRFWAIGIGSSPNMFLVDGVARQGGGMGKRLGLNDDTAALTQEVMNRIQRAQLAKLRIDWGDLRVAETYPAKLPELWAGRPVIVLGRYREGGPATITVRGVVEGQDASWPLSVELPQSEPDHDVLAKVWARWKIEDLMQQSFYAGSPAVEEEVTAIALDYQLMSPYTSFVAVDASKAGELTESATPPRRMMVPVPLPAGTRYEGFFGDPFPADVDELAMLGEGIHLQNSKAPIAERRKSAPAAAPGGAVPYFWSFNERSSRLAAAPRFNRSTNGPAPALQRLRERQLSLPMPHQAGRGLNRRGGALPAGLGGGGFGGGGFDLTKTFGTRAATRPGVGFSFDALGLVDKDEDRAEQVVDGQNLGMVSQVLRGQADQLAKQAAEAARQAAELASQEKLAAALAAWKRACFLDQAAANVGMSNGQTAGQALAEIERLRESRIAEWEKTLPALNAKLDLVLRDQSLAEALREISRASGVRIELVPGSVQDAAALRLQEPRVRFLDLRNATLAQALEWTLSPASLDWIVDDGRIVALSDRRRAGQSAWVYDVSTYSLPANADWGKEKDGAKVMQAIQKITDGLLAAVRANLQTDAESVVWFAPGQLLVMGDAKLHTRTAKLLADLADADHEFKGASAEVLTAARKRAANREEAVAARLDRMRVLRVASTLEAFGWQLLAAAANEKLDLEALTELQIAWKQPEAASLLEGKAAPLALKSCWVISEASRGLPGEMELASLAAHAREQSREAAERVLAELAAAPEDSAAFGGTLYATLARPDDGTFHEKAKSLLTASPQADSPLAHPRHVASALLAAPEAIDREALLQVIDDGPAGEELIVLTAIAARRAGGEVWKTFRAQARGLLSAQPLDGHVLVLVNRLEGASLPALAAR